MRASLFLFPALLLALATASCQRAKQPAQALEPFDGIEVVMQHASGLLLGLGPEEIGSRAGDALERTGRFVRVAPPPKGKAKREPWSGIVELHYARTVIPSAGAGPSMAEVAVRILLKGKDARQLRAEGVGQSELPQREGGSQDERFRQALGLALTDAAAQLDREFKALGLSDEELLPELESTVPQQRDLAIRILAERRSAIAVPELIALLGGEEDRERQLRVVGALVAIGDRAAATALIDATPQRDPAFVIQIVYALAQLGGTDAEAYLFTASTGHPDAAVRMAAAESLRELQAKRAASAAEAADAEPNAAADPVPDAAPPK